MKNTKHLNNVKCINNVIMQKLKDIKESEAKDMENKRPNHRPNKTLKTNDKLKDNFYTIYEVADILKVHHTTIRRAIRENRLNAFKIGSKWLIKKEDIQDLGGN